MQNARKKKIKLCTLTVNIYVLSLYKATYITRKNHYNCYITPAIPVLMQIKIHLFIIHFSKTSTAAAEIIVKKQKKIDSQEKTNRSYLSHKKINERENRYILGE